MRGRWLAFLLAASLAAAAAAGCGGRGVSKDQPIHGQVKVAGSTTLLPLAQEAATEFMARYPGTNVEVQGGGSSAGITELKERVIDIADSSRDLQPGENPDGTLVDFKVAFDIIAIVVNPANEIRNLSREQAKAIFTGKITNWKQLGGMDKEIVVVIRDQASGTREVFDSKVLGATPEKPVFSVASAIESSSNGVIREIVGSTKTAIGYISYGYVNNQIRPVSLDGVRPDIPNSISGRYPVARFLHMFTRGQPTGAVKGYIDFVLSDGFQDRVVGKEYVKVRDVKE